MILLVRHGEATHHTEHLTGGWTDSVLTEKGKSQMRFLAAKLAKDFARHSIKMRILASDLRRAKDSAEIIAEVLNEQVEVMPFLREKNNGQAAGLDERTARTLYVMPPSSKELDHRNYPGGETRREFFERTINGIKTLHNLEQENFIIVAHKGTIQNIIFDWIGFDIEEVNQRNFSFDILPASVTVLGINKWQEHAIFLLNETSHLRRDDGFGLFQFKYGITRR
jgi:probable phosphoglycerate mutase